jgi:prepilin-type N-terminal cleavage/methylation domain-containing protein
MISHKPLGFSLIEVLVSVAIIATLIVSVSLLMQRIPIDGREVRDQDVALRIARNEIEDLRALGYDALPASGPLTNTLLSALASSSAAVTVATWSTKTKRVDVTVSWRGAGLAMRSIVLTTLITQDSTL